MLTNDGIDTNPVRDVLSSSCDDCQLNVSDLFANLFAHLQSAFDSVISCCQYQVKVLVFQDTQYVLAASDLDLISS